MATENHRVIELIGGPLDGQFHEVHCDWPTPEVFGLIHENSSICWYRVYGREARWFKTEPWSKCQSAQK